MRSKLPVAYILIEQLQEAYLCTFCTCSHLPDSTGLACFGAWSGLQLCPVYGTVLVTALVWLQLWPGTALSGLRSVRVTARSGLQQCPVTARAGLQICPGYSSLNFTALSGLQLCPVTALSERSSVQVTVFPGYSSARVTVLSGLQPCLVTARIG